MFPLALCLRRTTPSACHSPLCFLRSSRRWLRCLLRIRLALACSHASPRQLLLLFSSPPPATRNSTSSVCLSRYIDFVVCWPFRLLGLLPGAGNCCPWFTSEGQACHFWGEKHSWGVPEDSPSGPQRWLLAAAYSAFSSHHGDWFLLSYAESPACPVRGSGADGVHA